MTDRWAVIDEHILQHRIVQALKALREEFGYSIHEAIGAFSNRYEQLWETRPQEFTVSREDHGKNVYT
jgi:hypothetical protein